MILLSDPSTGLCLSSFTNCLEALTGFEPISYGLENRCLVQLDHRAIFKIAEDSVFETQPAFNFADIYF